MLDQKKELLEFLQSILKPKHSEKKKYGEVFTPLTLVEQMLDKLPSHVWSDPSLTWLDPCVGSGNFMVCVYYRLMEGLKDCMPDESRRKEHILSQMLYMVELNPKNVYICKKIFGSLINIHEGDALTFDPEGESFGLKQFDIVIGNPPYQPFSNDKKGGKSLWPFFVRYAFDHLKEGGYLVYVHPALWRKPNNELHDLMFSKQFLYLSIHDDQDGQRIFQSTTRYDWYILQNKQGTYTCDVCFDDRRSQAMFIHCELPFIANRGQDILQHLYIRAENMIHAIRSCEGHSQRPYVKKERSDEFKYPLINSSSKSKGITMAWSSKQLSFQNLKKVIFSNGRIITPFYDKGIFGTTEGGIYIPVQSDQEGRIICRLLKSKLVAYIVAATKWSNFETNKEIFSMIPYPSHLKENFTDVDVYQYYELTDEMIHCIENDQKQGLDAYIEIEPPRV